MEPRGRPRILPIALAALLSVLAAPSARALQGTPNEGAWLGVSIQDLVPALRQHFPSAPAQGGVLVNLVLADSPAERAGLISGDVILELDGAALQSAEHLRQSISRLRSGTEVGLLVLRGTERLSLTVRLSRKPARVPPPALRSAPEVREVPWSRWFILDHEGGLGARMASLGPDLAEYFPGVAEGGVLVLEVCSDSPARAAGLRAGDVLVAAEGNPVRDLGDLRHELRRARSDLASLDLVRKGQRLSVTIELRTGPECWKGPGSTFFRLRPEAPSFRLLPEGTGDGAELPQIFRSVPEALAELWKPRFRKELTPPSDRQNFRRQLQQLEQGLGGLGQELEQFRKGLMQPATEPR